MFSTKKDVDHHVRTGLAKLRSESERNLRGFSIGKMYFKVGEYNSALHYVSGYLSVRDDSDQAFKLQGKCYEKLKQIDKAISAYQRSMQLNPKQPDLLIEVCQLIVTAISNDEQSFTPAKLRYWCDFATSQNINHDSLFNLKQKLLKRENASPKQLEDLLQKEIAQQPTKIEPRLQMIKLFLDQNRVTDAFEYAYDLEMKHFESFAQSLDWYMCLGQIIAKLNEDLLASSWQYWVIRVSSIERQLALTLTAERNSYSQIAMLTECTRLLFQFDQTLEVTAKYIFEACTEHQLVTQFLQHYRGQFCLHAAVLIFKRETIHKMHWREIIKNSMPLLLLAYNSGIPTTEWSRNSTENTKTLLRFWGQEAAFRCVQSGRTLLSFVDDLRSDSAMANIRKICNEKGTFTSNDELLAQIRQFCSDSEWRKKIYHILFTSNDQIVNKLHSSHFIQNTVYAEPIYEIPNVCDLDTYEEMAQLLYPSSLSHMVYLALNTKRLADFRCNIFDGLNFSVTNLANCGAETLNQLDVDSFLYASTVQARGNLNIERNIFETINTAPSPAIITKPKMLPFANIMTNLSTEEQSSWWSAAYRSYKNLSGSDLGEIRAILQYGIKAVRGVDGPKMDLMIYLRLGQIFMIRTQNCTNKLTERGFLEERTGVLFRFALYLIKMQNNNSLESFRKLFKYTTSSSFQQEKEINTAVEEAITYLAGRYFRNEEYEECIDELTNVQFPFATYFIAEAYRKMSDTNKTQKKNKLIYMQKAKEHLEATLALLDNLYMDKDHSLRSLANDEIKNIHQMLNNKTDHVLPNGNSLIEDYFNESYSSISNAITPTTTTTTTMRNRRLESGGGIGLNASFASIVGGNCNNNNTCRLDGGPNINELTTLMNKMMETLTIVQDDVVMVRAKLISIEEQLNKKQEIGSTVDPTSVLDDYFIGDELRNQAYINNSAMYQNPAVQIQSNQPLTQQRMQTPINQSLSAVAAGVGLNYSQPQQQQIHSYNNAFYNNAYPMNYPYQTAGILPALGQQQQLQQGSTILPLQSTSGINVPPRGVIGYGHHQPSPQYTDPNYYKLSLPPTDSIVGQSFDKMILDNINRQQTIITQLLQQNPQQQSLTSASAAAAAIPNPNPSTISLNSSTQPGAVPPIQIQRKPSASEILPSQQTTAVISPNTAAADNNPPILKSLPKNVVITNSDPLPPHNIVTSHQTLSVTIPSHHIKSIQTSSAQDLNVIQDVETNISVKQKTDAKEKNPANKFGGLSFSNTPITTPSVATANSTTTTIAATNVSTTISEIKPSATTIIKPNPFSNFSFSALSFGGERDSNVSNKSPATNFFGSKTTSSSHKLTDSTVIFGNLAKPFAVSAAEFPCKTTPTELNIPSTTGFDTPQSANISLTSSLMASANTTTTTTTTTTKTTTSIVAASTNNDNNNEEDDYVPTAHFEPVIALPDLVDTKTGEENEHIKFEHRAKILRFVRETKEWKERGIGNIKVLVNKSDPDKVRLLMRREQIFKLCCNQMLTKTMKFSPMGNSGNVLTWYGQDYSENELQIELLAIRFKTADICNEFYKSILDAQDNMSNSDTASVSVENLEKTVASKPSISESSAIKHQQQPSDEKNPTIMPTPVEGFGDKFKPAIGSWTCTGCYVTNKSNEKKCQACGTANQVADASIEKNSNKTGGGITPVIGFGDKFKVKAGSWECKSCYISNTAETQYCLACDSPKDETVPKKSSSLPAGIQFASTPSTFSFGVPFVAPTTTKMSTQIVPVTSVPPVSSFAKITTSMSSIVTPMPSTTISSGFSFGTFTAMTTTNSSAAGGSVGGIFGVSSSSATRPPQFSFSLNGGTKPNLDLSTKSQDLPALEPKETFSFVFKPKSPGTIKIKSPMKSTSLVEGAEDVTDDEDNIEEENNTYFMPVIPLPDKIEVKTGEEEEDILYSHRTKLYRYADSEWKERGLGDVKILKHKINGKLRVVMRREQVFKICLNHALTADIEYNKKDDKSWYFVANDYSEGAVELTQFCLRFKTADIAVEFKKAIDNSLSGELTKPIHVDDVAIIGDAAADNNGTQTKSTIGNNSPESTEKSNLSQADKQKLKELELPKDFFDEHPPCTGCRGCNSSEFQFPQISSNSAIYSHQDPLPLIMPTKPSSFSTPNQQQQQQIPLASAVDNNSILKQSSFSTQTSSKFPSDDFTKNIFGSIKPRDNLFGGSNSILSPDKCAIQISSDFSIKSQTNNNIFGAALPSNFSEIEKTDSSIFGGSGGLTPENFKTKSKTTSVMNSFSFVSPNNSSATTAATTIDTPIKPSFLFGTSSIATTIAATGTASPFAQLSTSNSFTGGGNLGGIMSKSNDESNETDQLITTGETKISTPIPIFGGGATFKSFATAVTTSTTTTTEKFSFNFGNSLSHSATSAVYSQPKDSPITHATNVDDSSASLPFKDMGISFASLASSSSTDFAVKSAAENSIKPTFSTSSSSVQPLSFFGLSNKNDFSNFSSKLNGSDAAGGDNDQNTSGGDVGEDPNYDPHYDPIIALPDEIIVSTGEEEEEKLFGERAKLFRYDSKTREWKERGVGELKILHHPGKETYRLLMRREQVFKCVLNHALSDDFVISPMKASDKAFCWATNNYADESAGNLEQLSVRFKNAEIAVRFESAVTKCISQLKLEPEDD